MTPPPDDPRRPGVYARLAQQADVERAVRTPPRGARVIGWVICLAIVAGVVAAAVGAHPLVAGRFIALEGVDGSGKSTQAAMLADALEARGLEVVRTREPGGTLMGERVREILLSGAPGEIGLSAEALLFAAARAELVRQVVEPALAAGRWVVSDRFIDSSLAYQGAARGLGMDAVLDVNRLAVGDRTLDLSVVIDVPVDLATSRRCATPDRIEAEGEGFLELVAEGYRELALRFPERVRLVDGEGTPDEVHQRVLATAVELM